MGYGGLMAKEGGGLTTHAVLRANQIKSDRNKGVWSTKDDNINNYNTI